MGNIGILLAVNLQDGQQAVVEAAQHADGRWQLTQRSLCRGEEIAKPMVSTIEGMEAVRIATAAVTKFFETTAIAGRSLPHPD